MIFKVPPSSGPGFLEMDVIQQCSQHVMRGRALSLAFAQNRARGKAYDTRGFVPSVHEFNVTPHVTQNLARRGGRRSMPARRPISDTT